MVLSLLNCVDDDVIGFQKKLLLVYKDGVILLEDLVFATVSHSHYWKNWNDHWTSLAIFPIILQGIEGIQERMFLIPL